MVTWQTFTAQLPSQNLQALATFVRDSFGTQGRPLTFLQFLTRDASTPNLADADTAALIVLWKALLLVENRATVDDYKQYVDLFEQPEQPLAAAFAAALEQAGIAYGAFKDGGADEQVDDLLRAGSLAYWSATRQALQLRGQRFVDEQGRLGAFAEAVGATWQAATTQLLDRIRTKKAYASLFSIAQTPLNRLAQDISPLVDNSVPPVSMAYFALLLQQLIDLAKQVVAENYTPELEAETFLSSTPISREATQAVLQVLAEKPAAAIAALATTSVSSLQPQLTDLLPANSPLVYAVAQSFQNQVTQFLQGLAPAGAGGPTEPAAIRQLDGRLTGAGGKPLANLGVRLTQLLSVGPPVIGELFTSPDGHFPIRLRQEYALSEEDTFSPLAPTLLVDVFAAGKPFSEEPDHHAAYHLLDDQQKVVVSTELSNDLPPLQSQAITTALPTPLQQYLTSNNIASLADIRQMGGLLNQVEATTWSEEVIEKARIIDASAQFELVSPNHDFASRVINEGQFYSPAQVINSTSKDEFVALLGGNTEAEREQASLFYERTVVVSTVLQALGLATGAEVASGTVDAPQARFIVGDGTGGPLDPVELGPLTSYVPGTDTTQFTYSPAGQCDCPACRSAVSPTAYLASLLSYASANLRSGTVLTSVSAQQLQDALLQPFSDLPVSCQYAEQSVCRYRLIVEVLRKHLRAVSPTSTLLARDSRAYLTAVYEALAAGAGTSAREIAQSTTGKTRKELADRLGITSGTLFSMQQKFNAIPDSRPLDEVEASLEEYFGFTSTSPTRDPLSTGMVLTQPNPIVRFTLQGVQWGVNVAQTGTIGVQILRETGKPDRLLVHRNNGTSPDEVVASGQLVPDAAPAITYRAVLYPQHDSGLRGSIVINGPLTGLTGHIYQARIIPRLTADRLYQLENGWKLADFEAKAGLFSEKTVVPTNSHVPSWNGFQFLIDPDVIGPDDFRPGATGGISATAGRAYVIWAQRLNFLQGQFINEPSRTLNNWVDRMAPSFSPTDRITYTPAGSTTGTSRVAWDVAATAYSNRNLSGSALLTTIQGDLEAADTERTANAIAALTILGMSPEALLRLNELRAKTAPTADEKEEGRQILRQTLKKTFEAAWADEETDAQTPANTIALNGRWFQHSIHEPIEGRWFPAPTLAGLGSPVIDPQEMTPLDLPDAGMGDAAEALWRHRSALLRQVQQAIFEVGVAMPTAADRSNAMMQYAFSGDLSQPIVLAPPYLGQPPYDTLEELSAGLKDPDYPEHGRVLAFVTEIMGLTAPELDHLIDLRSQATTLTSESTWQEMAALLMRGWKRSVAIRPANFSVVAGHMENSWYDDYPLVNRNIGLTDIANAVTLVYKQKLVKWRASAAARAKWVAALDQAFQRPLVDPDQLVPGDFHQAGKHLLSDPTHFINPAFELYYQRDQAVNGPNGLYARTAADWSDNGNVLGIASVLRASQAYLLQLYNQYLAQVDVAGDIARLNLTGAGLTLLMTFGADRAAEVRHLLVQVQRARLYADWTREEVALGIYQSPLYFRQVGAESAPPDAQAKPWRTSVLDWRAWHQDLAARYDQADAMAAATQQAVKGAEDQCLSLLRDALADAVVILPAATAPATPTRQDKLVYLGKQYLLDFEIACCQDTTRVGQTIEVAQKLFFNLENGLSDATHDLVLASGVAATFPQAWQWLSSYEQWRSLMFLYLYPQNVLLPSLKPDQTSQFRQIVSGIRQNSQVNPADACGYMHDYQAYVDELGSLKMATSVETYVETEKQGCFVATTEVQRVNMQIALSSRYTAYANLTYLESLTTPPVWNPIPGTLQVERVAGCVAYVNDSGERHVYVFVFLRTDPKGDAAVNGVQPTIFAFQRFNLRSLVWDDDYTQAELEGDGTVELTNVQVTAGPDESWVPIVVGLRNRRPTISSEYPLLIPTTTMPSKRVEQAFNKASNSVNNIDVFFTRLNVDGMRLRPQIVRTIWLISDISLIQAITLDREKIYTLFNVSTLNGTTDGLKAISTNLYVTNSVYSKNILDEYLGTDISWYRTTTSNGYGEAKTIVAKIDALINGTVTPYGSWGYERLSRIKNYAGNPIQFPVYVSSGYARGIGAKISGYRDGDGPTSPYTNPHGNIYDIHFNTYYPSTYNAVDTSPTFKLTIILPDQFGPGNFETGVVTGTNALTTLADRYEYIGPVWRPALPQAPALTASTAKATSTIQFKVEQLPSGARQSQATLTNVSGGTARILHQSPLNLPLLLTAPTDLAQRRVSLASKFTSAAIKEKSFLANVANEAYLALPLLLAGELLKGKYFDEALQYFRLIYDYTRLSATERFIYPGLQNDVALTNITDWLADPENPYLLAGLRKDSQLQFVVMNVARALLAYADSEFSRDTVESVAEARSFYELAGRLLQQDIIKYDVQTCASLLDPLDSLVAVGWQSEWRAMKGLLATVNQRALIDYVVKTAPVEVTANCGLTWLFAQAQAAPGTWAARFNQAWELVDSTLNNLQGKYDTLATTSNVQPPMGGISNAQAAQIQLAASVVSSTTQRPYVPFLGTAFCIPTNPIPYSYQLHAALGLYKIRTCRNISGIQRQLDAYAAPTDTTTGMPSIGTNGQLTQGGRLVIPATQYRYAYIVERARQVVALAQQAEAAFLAALEKRDAEAYNLLKAKQDIAVSRANIQLQDLRVREAEDGIDLAQLQLDRNQFMVDQYDEWLGDGLNSWEEAELIAIVVAGAARVTAAITGESGIISTLSSGGLSLVAAAANAVAAAADATGQYSRAMATYERRNNDWTFQRDLANREVRINQQQITIAHDQLNVVGQEKKIAQLQLDHTQAVVSFLNTKFTNAELYAWMSQVLQGAYSYFLQQATSLAKLAELQLAFERQEVPVNIIQQDYWSSPAEDSALASTATTTATDRKGLTGSIRLLQDVTRLDVYAFETNRRKLQLTKTVSLAQSFPTEFVRFRDTGLLSFACPQTWFDQDFPGHYLRTISRVRTSVIALVPTVDGIKARLGTAGLSRVTVAGTPFQSLTLPRSPEGVALTAAQNATGIFELNQQSELLYPFEGLGVDVPWSFSLQKAANPNLDYDSIADVLLTLEYTALEDYDYARQIIPQLGTERTQVVALSFRNRFADQWYDLHHAADLAPDDRYVARFNITAADLPRNLANLRLKNLSIYVDTPLDDTFTDRTQLTVGLRRDTGNGTGTSATAVANRYGLISTKTGVGAGPLYTGNAAALVPLLRNSPVGDWVLTAGAANMTDALRQRLANNQVNDIYLIIEVTGDAPSYALL